MKKFTSTHGFIMESISYSREHTYVVENDMDRTSLPENERWADLFPEVEIDGNVFATKKITGHGFSFPTPVNLKKGTAFGITVV